MIGPDGISIAQKLTLKEARENFGYEIEEIAAKSGISAERISQLEIDSTFAPVDEFVRLCTFYGTGYNHVYAGVAADVLKAREKAKGMEKPSITNAQHTELMAYWEMKKELLDIILLISNGDDYTKDEFQRDIAKVLTIVDVREKEAMSAITSAYTASVNHLR